MVELLISIVLTGLVMGSVIAALRMQNRMFVKGSIRVEAIQKARFANSFLDRELRVIGAGTSAGQPMVVYADEDAIVFNADMVTNDPDDAVAVYYDPDAPTAQTVGPDSAELTLPNGSAYPRAWHGPGRTPGRAETLAFKFIQNPDDRYTLVRQINALTPDTLITGLERPEAGFFAYQTIESGGRYRSLPTPLVHDAPVHGSPADTARSARTDSIRSIRVAFDVVVESAEGDVWRMPVHSTIDPRNLGLAAHASCGERPVLNTTPGLSATPTPGVQVTWPPAFDETGGEADVRQYNLYRAESADGPWTPLQTVPIGDGGSYQFEDASVSPGVPYWYALSATDCSPAESDWAIAGPISVSAPPEQP